MQTTMKHGGTRTFLSVEGLLVVAVEGFEGRLELRRQTERIQARGLAAALLGHLRTDVLPEVAVHRHLRARDVVGDRDTRQLDDPRLDGVHQREVAHRPREQRSFGVSGPAKEERGRGQVDDPSHPQLPLHDLQAGDPEAGRLVVLLRFLPLVPFQVGVLGADRLLAIAVVPFVVEDEDVLHPHQLGQHPLEHLALRLQRVQLGSPALEQRAAALR